MIASMRNLAGGKRAEAMELLDIAAKEKLKLSVVEIDVTRADQIVSGTATAQRIAGGALDALINNAGIGIAGPVETADAEAIKLIFDTNIFAYLHMARAVIPAMRKRKKGLIINVSSQLGRILVPNLGIYSGTKFAVEAMFETMAYELAPHGVEVTIVQPGGYPTKVWANGQVHSQALVDRTDAERKAAYAPLVAGAQRMGQGGGGTTDPMDVAKAFAELIAMAPGTRPLRRPVHPNTRATDAVNAACTQVQAAVLGNGPYADWHKAVTT